MRTGYQGCIRATRKKLRELKPDIVHGQGTERDCAISAVFSGFPNVVTIHGKMTEIARLSNARMGSFYWCAARLENFALPRTGGIVCISRYVQDLVKQYGVSTWLIPNALRQLFFDYPRTFREIKRPVLLNVGVVGQIKRQRQILQVLQALRGEGLEFETVFVGTAHGSYAEQFQTELAAAEAAHGAFSHIPWLDAEGMCRLFDGSSAMIHFSCVESFGLIFGEALARHLYLFASDVGSVRDISAGVPGVEIFQLDDWTGMKDAVRRWLGTEPLKAPKAMTSPEELVKRYHPGSVARQHLQVYREVLDRT
jgi:glycosyltransferase involved in cell wall biosynthesis